MTFKTEVEARAASRFPTAVLPRVVEAVANIFAAFKVLVTDRLVVVAPERVSIEKMEVLAALSTLNARPLIGV